MLERQDQKKNHYRAAMVKTRNYIRVECFGDKNVLPERPNGFANHFACRCSLVGLWALAGGASQAGVAAGASQSLTELEHGSSVRRRAA